MRTIRDRSAFTLIELVVSMAITSIIAVFVFGFATSLAKLWRTSEAGVGTELDTQIALDIIARDFESAVFLDKGVPMLAATAIDDVDFSGRWVDQSIRPIELDFDPASHYYGYAGMWLRFFTSAPTLNAVGYQVIRRPAFSDSNIPHYLLHRSVVRHDNTFDAGFDITSEKYSATATSAVAAGAIESPWVSSVLLEDVVDFGVRFYVFEAGFDGKELSPEGLKLIFPVNNGVTFDSDKRIYRAPIIADVDASLPYPDVVEVYIRVLDDIGADLLYRSEEIEHGFSYEEIVAKYGRLYRRMIRLPGREG